MATGDVLSEKVGIIRSIEEAADGKVRASVRTLTDAEQAKLRGEEVATERASLQRGPGAGAGPGAQLCTFECEPPKDEEFRVGGYVTVTATMGASE